jgi:hypothetical protein
MEPKLQLSKPNKRKMKIASLSTELIDAIRCCNELRLKQSLTLDVINSVEFLIKDSYCIDKQEFVKHILVKAFNLNDEEAKVVTEQINFLYENKHVKKFGFSRRLLNTVIRLFIKKNLLIVV